MNRLVVGDNPPSGHLVPVGAELRRSIGGRFAFGGVGSA